MSEGQKLLEVLLRASEKAANIARTCRQNHALFQLLIQEKKNEEKNPRFFQDFKTLADVLIQETIRHNIGLEFTELAKRVKGEETNVFSNTLGKTVIVQVSSSSQETEELLCEVLDNDQVTANLLATEIHRDVTLSEVPVDHQAVDDDIIVDIDDLGIWIDPIDSTADYINGKTLVDEATGLHLSGLRCVTVLIGAYTRSTGRPILGVVNQPFYTCEDSKWTGRAYWGFASADKRKTSLSTSEESNKIVVLSRCEDPHIKDKIFSGGYNLIETAGAGYKILSVAVGLADAYILSKGTTYRWDTCAPQALLNSLGGGILNFAKFKLQRETPDDLELKYLDDDPDYANREGFIAYRNPETLQALQKCLGFAKL